MNISAKLKVSASKSATSPSCKTLVAILPKMRKTEMKTIYKISISFIAILIIAFSLRGKISGEKFNSEKWKNSNLSSEENWTLRWDMMNSLRNNYELVGKKESEIIKLLGKPDSQNQTELIYSLGYSGTGINTGTLTIFIDTNRVVTAIKVHQG